MELKKKHHLNFTDTVWAALETIALNHPEVKRGSVSALITIWTQERIERDYQDVGSGGEWEAIHEQASVPDIGTQEADDGN